MPAEATGATVARSDFPCTILEGDDCLPYAVQGLTPSLVLLPESEEEAAQALAACNAAGLAVTPWGGGTLQSVGYPPQRLDAVLSTERLSQVVTYQPDDLTISAQAGCTVARLDEVLSAHGQMLPFGAADAGRATIGGAVAVNLAGPRRFGAGSYRDLLIGIVVAAPDGIVTKGGGLVVKNVSGYDLMKLHLGALGTLGLILRLNFKVLTRPTAEATGLVSADRGRLLTLAAELAGSQLAVDSLELVGPSVPHQRDASWRLAVRLTGSANGLSRKRSEVEQLCSSRSLDLTWSSGAPMLAWWRSCLQCVAPSTIGGDEALLRLVALPSEMAALIDHVEQVCASTGLAARAAAQAGTGDLFARLSGGAASLASALPEAHAALAQRWQHVTVLASPPDLQQALDVWGPAPAALPLMRRIKEQFDPKRTLNPGRYVGRI
jgi:glycolate oxidase FAD binding subunit